MFKNISKNSWLLHVTVLIWGFTGILGVLINTSALYLVWYRVLIATISLLIYLLIKKRPIKITKKQFIQYTLTGGAVGLHWILFFSSIKLSTVSVTLVCLSSATLFTAFLEPIIKRQKIEGIDIITGLIIIFGIYLIFAFETKYLLGIILGILAALIASIFAIVNSNLVSKGSATLIGFYEMLGAFLWISLFMFITNGFNNNLILQQSDLLYLIILGTVCTAAAYVLAIAVMKELSAFTVALATNLEPIYGIILALLFFGSEEKMSAGFYVGACIVLGTVLLYPYFKKAYEKRRLRGLPL
jgi:drug/metabolite transporter (DMT)-like permease